MPPDTRSRKSTSGGADLEARVAQVWFWEGSFARRGVNLQHYFMEPLDVTDLDLLAVEVSGALTFRRTIGEAKSGTGKNAPKPLDRIIWLRGLMDLTNAHRAELTCQIEPNTKTRQLADALGVAAQSTIDLERRETSLRIAEVADLATFGVRWKDEPDEVRRTSSSEPELERIFWFLRSEVWFLDHFQALKRTISAIGILTHYWTPNARDSHEHAVRWMLCEATVLATYSLVGIAGTAIRLGGDDLTDFVEYRLAEGSIPAHRMHALSKHFDEYLSGVLKQVGVPAATIVSSLGAFEPTPPAYASSVVELVRRLAAGAAYARHLPRWADFMCFERVLRGRNPSDAVVGRLGCADIDRVSHAGRLVATFLRGQAGLPELLANALGTPRLGPSSLAETSTEALADGAPNGISAGGSAETQANQLPLAEGGS